MKATNLLLRKWATISSNKVMAHPELLKSKVLFKLKHWFPIDLEIELVYRLNLKVFQFLLEFCENGLICLL